MQMETIKSISFKSIIGNLKAYMSEKGLLFLELPGRSRAKEWLSRNTDGYKLKDAKKQTTRIVKQISEYFARKRKRFSFPLDIRGTAYQMKVWGLVMEIPYGFVVPYSYIAVRMNAPHSSRAVAQALASNPLPIVIPCHRVIAKSGELGGFSGSKTAKKRLLSIEGVSEKLMRDYKQLFKVGRCGFYCEFCEHYSPPVRLFSKKRDACHGCNYPLPSKYNRDCKIRAYLSDMNLHFCYECKNMSTRECEEHLSNSPPIDGDFDLKKSLKLLKRNRVSVWLKKMAEWEGGVD